MLPTDPVRRRRAGRALAAVLGLVVVASLVGVTVLGGDDEPSPDGGGTQAAPEPSDTGTPLAEVDTRVVAAAREPFCDAVEPAAVLRALDVDVEESGSVRATSWENGQATRLEPGLRDVAHEAGCSWSTEPPAQGVRARAWVFVPPTTTAEARDLQAGLRGRAGCDPIQDAPAFGAVSAAVACTQGKQRERVYAGLFGDAWLTCSLTTPGSPGYGPPAAVAERADAWCAEVVGAAASDDSAASDASDG